VGLFVLATGDPEGSNAVQSAAKLYPLSHRPLREKRIMRFLEKKFLGVMTHRDESQSSITQSTAGTTNDTETLLFQWNHRQEGAE
jgi:hypothetical protein